MFWADGQKARRFAATRENPQTGEKHAWGIPPMLEEQPLELGGRNLKAQPITRAAATELNT
jgi:hypothetical protein